MDSTKSPKTYANTFVYSIKDESGYNSEKTLITFIKGAKRINKADDTFRGIRDQVKVRQTTAVLYRVLMNENVILCINDKELPPSFKVFEAKDIKSMSKLHISKPVKRLFIDCTGLIAYNESAGLFTCKDIDKFLAYLIGAMITMTYYDAPMRITNNASVINISTKCFIKLFTTVLDNLRVSNYSDNKDKICYLVGIYYLYNLMGKDISYAEKTSSNILGLRQNESSAWNLYFNDEEKDMTNIDSFIGFLTDTFKLRNSVTDVLNTDIFINKWYMLYGKGCLYGLEIPTAFLMMITNAYSGSYINNQKLIENICGGDMIDLTNSLITVGSDVYDKGFSYKSDTRNDINNSLDKAINPYI